MTNEEITLNLLQSGTTYDLKIAIDMFKKLPVKKVKEVLKAFPLSEEKEMVRNANSVITLINIKVGEMLLVSSYNHLNEVKQNLVRGMKGYCAMRKYIKEIHEEVQSELNRLNYHKKLFKKYAGFDF